VPDNFINPSLYNVKTPLDTKNHVGKHGVHVGESFLNPKKYHFMTPMQTQTKNTGLIKFLMRVLDADKILDVKKVKPGVYYVYYKRCEYSEDDGECFFIESYITIKGKNIEEKIISIPLPSSLQKLEPREPRESTNVGVYKLLGKSLCLYV
jgi:hypothetical protein